MRRHGWLRHLVFLFVVSTVASTLSPSHALRRVLSGNPVSTVVPAEQLPASHSLNSEVVLTRYGGPLLVSNNPDYLSSTTVVPGALYRDRVDRPFRVFYHHANGADEELTVATAVTNLSDQPVLLFRRGAGQGNNVYPDVAGQKAVSEYLASRSEVHLIRILAPHASVVVAPQTLVPGSTASAVQDFVALKSPPVEKALPPELLKALEAEIYGRSADTLATGLELAELLVTVTVYQGADPQNPASLPVVSGTPPKPIAGTPYYALSRGTFAHGDRYAELKLEPARGSVRLSVDSAAYGPYSQAMTGEYEVGTSAVDGGLQGYINGNYGVFYSFRLGFNSSARAPYRLLLQPSGGSGHYALKLRGEAIASPFLSHLDAWWFYDATSYGYAEALLETSLPGGSYGPQKFFFVPELLLRGRFVSRPLSGGPEASLFYHKTIISNP